MINQDNKLSRTRSVGYHRIIKPVIHEENSLMKFRSEKIQPTIIKERDIIYIKIISAKNKYFWYFQELKKHPIKRRIFQAFRVDNGIVTNEGFVYDGSFEMVHKGKKNIDKAITFQNNGDFIIK